MNKDFVPYEEALGLKALGFEETCYGFYNQDDNNKPKGFYPANGNNSAPLYQQAFRWLYEISEGSIKISYLPAEDDNQRIKRLQQGIEHLHEQIKEVIIKIEKYKQNG